MKMTTIGGCHRRRPFAIYRRIYHCRHSLFGVSAHLLRAIRRGGKGQPSFLARMRIATFLRPKAAAARTTDALSRELFQTFIVLRHPYLMQSSHAQWPKIIAPIVKKAAPTQIQMAAFFSEIDDVGFMAR
jgi:hypothetical protein